MKQDERIGQYRLHHLPFLVMWVATFGVAWLGIFMAVVLWSDIRYDSSTLSAFSSWVYHNARWIDGVLIGAGLGALLALVQPWLMRWRYGFAPRYWGLATFIGALLSGSVFSSFIHGYGYTDYHGNWIYPDTSGSIIVWFGALTLVQAVVLWPVARRTWLYPLAGFGAMGIGIFAGNISAYGSINQPNVLFFGTVAQAVFSGALFLWLMRDYRVEAVPKRDEKSKGMARQGLSSMSFIGLWMMAHLFSWVTIGSLILLASAVAFFVPFLNTILGWVFNNPISGPMIFGLIVGAVVSPAQAWLINQYSAFRPKRWMLLSLLSWAMAGLALSELIRYASYFQPPFPYWIGLMFALWFGLPPLVQSLSLRRGLRGTWLYALSGLVSASLAYFLSQQLGNDGFQSNIYGLIFGAGLQALLTGTAFLAIVLQNRQNQLETQSVSGDADTAIEIS